MAGNKVTGWSSLEDVRLLAKRNLPAPIFDFIYSGAGNQITARGNEAAFDRRQFIPRIGVDVSSIDTSTTIMGAKLSFPLIIAPMGGLGMIDPDSELELAKAASDAGILFVLSSYSTRSLEQVAAVSTGPKIFQVYMLADEGLGEEYLRLAAEHRYNGIAITLDTAAQQTRDPFQRWNVFGMGGGIPLKTKLAFARHPGWVRRQKVLGGISTDVERRTLARGGTLGPTFHEEMIRKDVGWDDIAKIAKKWSGPIAVKGVLSAEDARRAVDSGATAIMVCNHGGIVMDGAPPTLDLVEQIKATVGSGIEVIQSGGLRRGAGIAKALALGADAVMTGRPFAYGLAAGGGEGAAHVIGLLRKDFEDMVKLCGCRSIAEVQAMTLRNPD